MLIVDDAPDAREMYALYLKFAGYEAITASDGDIGIDFARRLKPDVIVMISPCPG